MKKCLKKSLFMLAAGTIVASCADYNVTDNFIVQSGASEVSPYDDLGPIKSYVDRNNYPNLKLGTTLSVKTFNKQELDHAAALTNFDYISLGSSLMPSNVVVNDKGVMNFLDMMDMVSHAKKIDWEIHGSPLFANSNQADGWLNTITGPIEVPVEKTEGKHVDYSKVEKFEGWASSATAGVITKYENKNALKIALVGKVNIIEGFEVDPHANYEIIFHVKADKDATFNVNFSGSVIDGNLGEKWTFKGGEWRELKVEGRCAPDATEGFLRIENTRSAVLYISDVSISYFPDNHREQTAEEKRVRIDQAIRDWCDGIMKNNDGLIKSFDLIDDAIDAKNVMENGMYDLKHSEDKVYWQDVIGSENYAPQVSNEAVAAFQKYGGNSSELKFFIAESGLDNQQKFESLKYWIDIWTQNGAKIDGINAKLSLAYSEDADKQASNIAAIDKLFDNLASTGKLIRISNFDIRYQNVKGLNVSVKEITEEQRQKLADYNAYVLRSYMNKIPKDKQAGICKNNLVDTASDPVGLWANDPRGNGWIRTATYKAWCDALSGK